MQKFRMYGRIVELYRWKVSYIDETEQPPLFDPETGKETPQEPLAEHREEYFPSEEEADAVATRTRGTKTPIDVTGDEWLDGLEVDDVPDTMGEALRIYNEGQAALIRQQRNDLLRATDWTQAADAPFTEQQQEQIRAYRRGLRDLPQQEGFPEAHVFPAMPIFLK